MRNIITVLAVGLLWFDVAQAVIKNEFDGLVGITQQPSAKEPDYNAPIRNLTWGQLNIIHTTDTHGWLPGHLLEPNFGADWGDLYSFVARMKEEANRQGNDLIMVDSGDRHDGNGLSDATYPGGLLTEYLFLEQEYDIITIGNHELYKYESAITDYQIVGQHFGERYVVSNVDILVNNTWKPMGNRYRRFTTENQKLNVIGYGFLFNFMKSNSRSRVTFVQDAIKQKWFQESLSYNDTDVFIVSGHIPVRFFPEMHIITDAIRKVHPNAAIQFLGGHSHIRDYVVIDKKATALESGRFLETVGWASIDNIDNESDNEKISFSRSYIDTNLYSYSYHSGTQITDKKSTKDYFFTDTGLKISDKIKKIRKKLKLDDVYGCVPKPYLLDRAEYPGPHSLFSLIEEMVLPRLIGTNVSLSRSLQYPRFIIINTGSIRFDLFQGPFTRDSGFIVSPFVNNWLYMPDVPLKYAKKIIDELNKLPYIFAAGSDTDSDDIKKQEGRITTPGLPPLSYSDMNLPQNRALNYRIYDQYEGIKENVHQQQVQGQTVMKQDSQSPAGLTKGYVTYDDLGQEGDDTIHEGWRFFPTPNAIQASQNIPSDDDDNLIDVVFYDFIQPYLFDALNKIGYHNITVRQYGGLSTVEMLADFIVNVWPMCE